jgi:hypothetical protein
MVAKYKYVLQLFPAHFMQAKQDKNMIFLFNLSILNNHWPIRSLNSINQASRWPNNYRLRCFGSILGQALSNLQHTIYDDGIDAFVDLLLVDVSLGIKDGVE